jgi:PilZ domain
MNSVAQHNSVPPTVGGLAGVVFGRFMLPDMSEHACQVLDMSAEGATFITSEIPAPGLAIVAYLEDLGRVEVKSSTPVPGGFKVLYSYSGARLERLLTRIDWVKQRTTGAASDQRRHARFEPKDKASSIVLPDGRVYACEVMDISVSGAAIKTDVMPSIGTHLMVGKMKGRVVRYLENGVGIEFVKHLEQKVLASNVA